MSAIRKFCVLVLLAAMLAGAPAAFARFHGLCDTTGGQSTWGDQVDLEVVDDEIHFSGEVHCIDASDITIHGLTLTSVVTGETTEAGEQVDDAHSARREGVAPLGDGLYDLYMTFTVEGTNAEGTPGTLYRTRNAQWLIVDGSALEVCNNSCVRLSF